MTCSVLVQGFPEITTEPGRSLLEICEEAGIPVEAACGGFACCNTCRVEVLDDGSGLTELLPEEEPFLDASGQRLGCQAQVIGPVRVRLAPGA